MSTGLSKHGNERAVHLNLEQRLRESGKIPLEDRPIMAERLGEIAIELNPERPLHAIKHMWANAWGEDQSFDKRKRLVRLPAETGPLEYEAAAPKWCKLIAAAAELLNQSGWSDPRDGGNEQVFRRVLRGTSFRPQQTSLLQPGTSLAQELLETLNMSILSAVRQETSILDLWAATAKGATEVVVEHYDEADLPEITTAVEAAAQRACELPEFDPAVWAGARFTIQPNVYSDWMFPSVEIGALIQSFSIPVFKLPDAIAEKHDGWEFCEFGGNDVQAPVSDGGVVGQWLRNELTTRGVSFSEFMKTDYFTKSDSGKQFLYGWQKVTASKIHRLRLNLERRQRDGEPILALRAYDTCQLIPASIRPEDVYKNMLAGTSYHSVFRGSAGYPNDEKAWMWLPTPDDGSNVTALSSAIFLGYTEEFSGRDLDKSLWLKDWFSEKSGEDLTCRASDIRFAPAIHLEENVPEAYPRKTPLGALLVNAIGPKEHRVSSILLEQAKKISELGNGYLNALADHYRTVMMS